MQQTTIERRFTVLGWIEGVSWLLLFGVAMPLKYAAGRPELVKIVGPIHGVLWLAFLVALLYVSIQLRWKLVVVIVGFFASILPFGPWIFDRWRLKKA